MIPELSRQRAGDAQFHDLELGLRAPVRRASEESVTSPMAAVANDTFGALIEMERTSRQRVLSSTAAAPRSASTRNTSAAPVPARPTSSRARTAGATVREQRAMPGPSAGAIAAVALRAGVELVLWSGLAVGACVATIYACLRNNQRSAAIVNGVISGLIAAGVTIYSLARWVVKVADFALGENDGARYLNLDALRLEKEIEFWQEKLGRPKTHPAWHLDRSNDAKLFACFLGKIEQSLDYLNPRTRPMMTNRVGGLLDEMDRSRALRSEIYRITQDAFATCGDRVVLGLNNMELAIQNRKAEDGVLAEKDLLELGRGMFRLDMIEKFAWEKGMIGGLPGDDGVEPDDVEALLNLQSTLREPLNLPIPVFAPGAGSHEVTEARVNEAHELLRSHDAADFEGALKAFRRARRDLAAHPERPLAVLHMPAIAEFLAINYTPWERHVARNYKTEQARLRDLIGEHQSRLDEHFECGARDSRRARAAFGGHGYNELSRRAMFFYNHGTAYERALISLIEARRAG